MTTQSSTILPKILLTLLLSIPLLAGIFLPNTAQASNTTGTLTLDDVFTKVCKEKLGANHSFCTDKNLSDFDYDRVDGNDPNLSAPAMRLSHDYLTTLFPNINKLLCFHSRPSSWGDPNARLIYAWNNNTGNCELAGQRFSMNEQLSSSGRESCSEIITDFLDINLNNDTIKLAALAFNSENSCDSLANANQSSACTKMRSHYQTCLANLDQVSENLFKPAPTPSQPWNASGELSSIDFYDMSLYAKYAYTVLNSCLRSNKTYCKNLNQSIAVNLPNLNTNVDFNDAGRLTSLIGLVAYGSTGPRANGSSTEQFDELKDIRISDLPNLLANTWVEVTNYRPDNAGDNYQLAINLDRSSVQRGVMVNFACSSNKYEIVRSHGVNETALCKLASRLDFLMNQDAGILSCDYLTSPTDGANNLLRFCQADNPDIAKCEIATRRYADGEAFLHESKTKPIFLETMYWNVIDSGYKDKAQVKWARLTQEQKDYINYVVTHPDTSAYVERNKCILSDTNSQAQPEYDAVCKVEGGLGWAICGAAEGLLNSFDTAYAALSQHLPINTNAASTTTTVGDQSIKGATFIVWQQFVSLANIVVAIIVLISIVSYLTGFGLSDYQIKVILPKLIVTVLLINLSFVLIQFLIDMSNLIGDGLYNTFLDLTSLKEADAKMVAANIQSDFWNRTVWSQALDVLFMAVMLLIWVLSSVLQLFVVAGREVILVMTIVSAPLAIALFALPNTQKITKLWQNGFIFALLLYPIITLVFAVSRIGFLVTYDHSYDLLSGIFARTVLILPFLASPYLMVKVGKNVPLVKSGINRMTNFGRNFFSRNLPAPKPNSWRDFTRQRRQHRRDLASRGELTGLSNILNPLRWPNAIRNQIARQFGRGEAFSANTLAGRRAQDQARLEAANLLKDNNDYEKVLNHYNIGAGRSGATQNGRTSGRESAGISKLLLQGVNHQELILSAALAKLQKEQELGSTTRIQDFAHALHVARSYGASQSELQAAYNQALASFKGTGNFSATGDLKALAQWGLQNPESNGNTWGWYSEDDWNHTATDADGHRNAFTELRRQTNRSDMIHQVLEQPVDQNGNKITLDARSMFGGSLAAEVFSQEYNNNADFEDAIRNQANSFSSGTFGAVDTILNQGLRYNALTANLDATDFANLDAFAAGTLSAADEQRLRDKIFRIQGHHINAAAVANSSEINLAAIQQMTGGLTAISPDNYGNLVGWSFKNTVVNLPPIPTRPTIQQIQNQRQQQDNSWRNNLNRLGHQQATRNQKRQDSNRRHNRNH